MKANMIRVSLAGFVFLALAVLTVDSTNAQCSTCATPTVAYQPVAVQPAAVVTTQNTGWYLGRWFDRRRMRRYGVSAPAYTAAYAPYTASYPSYTAGYAPYVTGYAPLARTVVARPVMQTSYYAASPCSSCVQTVARPVALSPVVTTGCSACGVPSCGGCSSCSTIPAGVSQASFTQPGCSSCASSVATPSPSLAPTNQGTSIGPPTPQPQLSPTQAAPSQSNYLSPTPADGSQNGKTEPDPLDRIDPLPQKEGDTSTSFGAPQLFDPNDRTAQRRSSKSPTVDVWDAVYRKPSAGGQINKTSYKPAARTHAEIDAEGWQSVPRSR